MNFFVASSSKATAIFAGKAGCPRIKYFSDNAVIPTHVLPDAFRHQFDNADVLVINGTWGNELRKSNIIKGYNEGKLRGGIIPRVVFEGNKISYKNRSAILDYINTELVKVAKEQNKPIIVFESPTISRANINYSSDFSTKHFTRIGLDSWMYKDAKWLTIDDFEEIQTVNAPRLYNHNWKQKKEGAIYILAGLETDPTSTFTPKEFIKNTIEKIRLNTNKQIYIKLHPGTIKLSLEEIENLIKLYKNVSIIPKSVPIQKLYSDMYCAVIDNSTSIFELIDAGIPTFCSDINFGADLLNTDVNNICNPYFATQEEVLLWTNKMSCTELSSSIIRSDKFVTYAEKLVNRHSNGI